MTKQSIGVWGLSNTMAVELLDIEYGIEDVAIIKFGEEIEEATIQYDEERTYIQCGEIELDFAECIRI